MSSTVLNNLSLTYTEGSGHRCYKNVISEHDCDSLFTGLTLEAVCFMFGDEAYRLIQQHGFDVTKLIADANARRQAGIPDDHIRRNGNTRNSKVLKRSGKTAIYISPYIRDLVRRNKTIFEILASMYNTKKLAFTTGLEHFLYKSEASEESVPVLDCKFFEPFGDPTSNENPFHYNCFVVAGGKTIFDSKTNQNDADGGFSILEGFDVHFEDIKNIVGAYGAHPIAKQKKQLEVSLLEDFNLKGVNDELRKLHQCRMLSRLTAGQPFIEFKPLQWVKLNVSAGDVIVFDCRLPYMTAKNRNSRPALYIPVSLRPVSPSWYGSPKHQELLSSIKMGKVGNWQKRLFKSSNLEEFAWRSGLSSMLPASSLQRATDTARFTDQDNLIFGISRYEF